MKYIQQEDYEYIINKYHDENAVQSSLDGVHRGAHIFNRFIRRDDIFDESTGLSAEEITNGILEDARAHSHLSHAERKARALAYVLKNTRISCNPRDIFPAIHMVDRPLRRTLIDAWSREVFTSVIPEVGETRARLEDDCVVTIWPDYDHSVPVWDRVLSLGFAGLLRESEAAREGRALSFEEEAFFEGIRITYEGILAFIDRLYCQARNTAGAEKMARALKTLRHGAPETFYEALLLIYLYFMISEHVDALQVRSLSNFDRCLYPFYRHDLARGVPEEELRRELAYFLLQFTAIGNYWGQPVFFGGEQADGSTEINELSELFLDVYDKMGLYNPKLQIKVSDSTPKAFLRRALDMIRRGHNSIVFVCDDTVRRALTARGATAEAARLANITGCYEYSCQGSYVAYMNYANLLKPLEYALHEGRDGVTGKLSGLPCPPPSAYASFDELYAEYKRQLAALIDLTVATNNAFDGYLSRINPLSLLSATFPSCLSSAKDAIGGGAEFNDTEMEFGFLADLVDSLTMIQKYVYDQKLLTLAELVSMLDADFRGNEVWAVRFRADREKYGNNKDRPDGFAVDVSDFILSTLHGRPNSAVRGGKWVASFHVARMSYVQGAQTAATPNGRRLGEELSKNASASMGQNREGATAAILSVTKINAAAMMGDVSLDLGLLPASVRGEEGLDAMCGLLSTFCHRGGHALHINVFDANTLREAQVRPEKYRDLQIRVCGWNALWNNICKEEQDGFIRQAEALV